MSKSRTFSKALASLAAVGAMMPGAKYAPCYFDFGSKHTGSAVYCPKRHKFKNRNCSFKKHGGKRR